MRYKSTINQKSYHIRPKSPKVVENTISIVKRGFCKSFSDAFFPMFETCDPYRFL